MSRIAATLIVLGLYALHQDIWFWNDATPLVYGVLPIGLFYHVAYTMVTAIVMAALVKTCWPRHLDPSLRPAQGVPSSSRDAKRRAGGFAGAQPPES